MMRSVKRFPLQSNSAASFAELERARPYKPNCLTENFEADKFPVLAALREAGPRGITTLEFLQRGIGGLRPPNRVHDCRKDGHIIETRREGRGQFRFILIRDADGTKPDCDWYTAQTSRPRPSSRPQEPADDLPLFTGVGR